MSNPDGRPRTPLAQRLAASYLVNEETGCWEWQRSKTKKGYALITIDGSRSKKVPAHRAAYELHIGPIPDGLVLDHVVCRNPGCVNPWHLEPVTNAENILRGTSPPAINARKTHCIHGHPLTGANVYVQSASGGRGCRACRDEYNRAYRAQHRAA